MKDEMTNRFGFIFEQKAPLLAYFAHGKHDKTHTVYSMEDDKIYTRRIPQLAQKHLIKCKYGWLVMAHPESNPRLQRLEAKRWSYSRFSLINPISMERIDLPPVPVLHQENRRIKKRYIDPSGWLFDITTPPTDDDCIVFLIAENYPFIKFCYLREKKWFVRHYDEHLLGCSSTAMLNEVVYCLTDSGKLLNLLFYGDQVTTKLLDVEKPKEKFEAQFSFLIESKGELYMVCSVEVFRTTIIKGFNVFKMDFSLIQWVAVSDIGDRAFFLDFAPDGLSCDAHDQTGLKKNSIYYIEENRDIYQYSLEDRSVIMLRPSDEIETPCLYQPIWVSTQCLQGETNFDSDRWSSEIDFEICSKTDLEMPKQFPNQDIRRKSQQEGGSLPNFLPEVVLEIMQRLSYHDCRYAGIAFPAWHPTIRSAQKQLSGNWAAHPDNPCHLSFSDDYKSFRLIDPLRNGEWLLKSCKLPTDLKVVYSKHGWLLLMVAQKELIFYNPLSQAVIELPPFESHYPYRFSFSSAPTTFDCVVVGSMIHKWCRAIIICRKGEHEWDEIIIDYLDGHKDNPKVGSTNAVFFMDSFYWLHDGGEIGILNIMTETFELHGKTNINVLTSQQRYLVECNDELFLVLATNKGGSVRVYKLDRDSYAWKETQSLGGCSFFLSPETTIGVFSHASGEREDRLYFCFPMSHNKRYVYYSMQKRKLFPYGNFFGSKRLLHSSSWIEPHWDQNTSEELCWSNGISPRQEHDEAKTPLVEVKVEVEVEELSPLVLKDEFFEDG